MPGGGELLLIIGIALLLFGGDKALAKAKTLGKEVYNLKKDVEDIKEEVKVNIIDK
jgi:Sec-independent protein translocase protein TatA